MPDIIAHSLVDPTKRRAETDAPDAAPGGLLAAFRTMPPLQVSHAELRKILLPLTIGYAWGEGTIHDLWIMGAPLPHDTTKRVVFPGQLAKWLEDVLTRQGRPLSEAAKAYSDLRIRSV
jgi:hypothetical protein